MPDDIVIRVTWEGCDSGPVEDRVTAARMRLEFGGHVATQVDNRWSGSVHDDVLLSAYPLALWLARSWWRLRWEPLPLWGEASAAWRMAHEMPAAGHGFLWPRLCFASDGESVIVSSRPTPERSPERIRYLARFDTAVDAMAFEREVDGLIGRVLARLEARKVGQTDLHRLWAEVLAERGDAETALWRKLEAQLGFDPDEAPEQVLEDLEGLSAEAGVDALSEIAPALAGRDPRSALAQTLEAARSPGVVATISAPLGMGAPARRPGARPWERGRSLAASVRSALGLTEGVVPDSRLAELFDVSPRTIAARDLPPVHAPFGIAVREGGATVKMLLRRRSRTGVRFEAARILADWLTAEPGDRWLPVTDSRTARQKLQRAFAAELLCPMRALEDFLAGVVSDERIEEAAEHFGVSPLVVTNHIANQGGADLDPVRD